jgi:hypothetical protein
VQKPTTVVQSKDQGPYVELVNNCITTQDNEERIAGIVYGSFDQSRHTPELIPAGTLIENGELILMKELVDETN